MTQAPRTACRFSLIRLKTPAKRRLPKILYLADRNILVDQPKDGIFAAFSDARWKIEDGVVNLGREMYFAIFRRSGSRFTQAPSVLMEFAPHP